MVKERRGKSVLVDYKKPISSDAGDRNAKTRETAAEPQLRANPQSMEVLTYFLVVSV